MKFGRDFYRYEIPEWEHHYVNYSLLKVLVRRAISSSSYPSNSPELKELVWYLNSSIDTIEEFRASNSQVLELKVREIRGHPRFCHIDQEDYREQAPHFQEVWELQEDCRRLERFERVNSEAIERIFGKLEIHGGLRGQTLLDCRERWLAVHSEFETLISTYVEETDAVLDRVRPRKQPDPELGAAYQAIRNNSYSDLSDALEREANGEGGILSETIIHHLLTLSITYGSAKCIGYLFANPEPNGRTTTSSDHLFHLALTHGRIIMSRLARCQEDPEVRMTKERKQRKNYSDIFHILFGQFEHERISVVRERDKLGRSLFHHAARYGLTEICQRLSDGLQRFDGVGSVTTESIISKDLEGCTPFHLAVIHGHSETLGVLMDLAMNPWSGKKQEKSVMKSILGELLHIALKYGHQNIVDRLVSQGVDINHQPGVQKKTAVYVATELGDSHNLELLLRYQTSQPTNLDIAESVYGWTPLIVASVNGHAAVADILLAAGADPKICDQDGWNAQGHAAFRGHLEIAQRLSTENPGNPTGPGTGRQRRRKVNTNTPRAGSHGCVAVTLGTMHRSRQVKSINLDGCSYAYTPDFTGAYSMNISVHGKDSSSNWLQLPVLVDMSADPFLFPIDRSGTVEVAFKVYRSPAGNRTTPVLFCAGTACLGGDGHDPGIKHENLVREHTVSLLAKDTMELVGTITFTYVIMKPFQHPAASSINTPFPRTNAVQIVGHRGLGQNVAGHERLQIGENTAQSFLSAGKLGAKFVEFGKYPTILLPFEVADDVPSDVQVTRDLEPVIYHDFSLSESGTDVPIHDLTREQFLYGGSVQSPQAVELHQRRPRSRSLTNQQERGMEELNKRLQLTVDFHKKGFKPNSRGQFIQDDFATLEQLLQTLPDSVGFAVEIKYPRLHEAVEAGIAPIGIEINAFVDCVLEKIFTSAGNRHIILSSFTPEVCMLLALKQKQFPVMFITNAGRPPLVDMEKRGASLQVAVRFAKCWNLFGVVFAAEPLMFFPGLIEHVKASCLVCASYGPLNNDPNNVKLQVEAGLDMVIADEVGIVAKALKQIDILDN